MTVGNEDLLELIFSSYHRPITETSSKLAFARAKPLVCSKGMLGIADEREAPGIRRASSFALFCTRSSLPD